eukprot:m.27935 g.27935  ORF g.27935 m.27935 type:complete len:240 (-) comp11790_c0_seq1:187-906(-)
MRTSSILALGVVLAIVTLAHGQGEASNTKKLTLKNTNTGNFVDQNNKCYTFKKANEGFYFKSVKKNGIALVDCERAGQCGCKAVERCTREKNSDRCLKVSKCTDKKNNKRCWKLAECDSADAQAQVQFNFDPNSCETDLTDASKSELNAFMANLKLKATRNCGLKPCQVYASRKQTEVVDGNSFILDLFKSRHAESLEECLVGKKVAGCAITSSGEEQETTSSTTTSTAPATSVFLIEF